MSSTTYRVSLAAFEGPFDLLLHLIARSQLDVYEVPIAQITDDYLAVLRAASSVDLEVTTEFLVVAATLLELKAARLLPVDETETDDLALEARDLLYARLLDYRTFKQAAAWIRDRQEASLGLVPRQAPLEAAFSGLRPDVAFGVDADGLARLAAAALAARREPTVDLGHVQPVRMTVAEAAAVVVARLQRAGGRITFRALTVGCRTRAEVVVHFLALLELYKSDLVELEQESSFGDLVVEVADGADPLGLVLASGATTVDEVTG